MFKKFFFVIIIAVVAVLAWRWLQQPQHQSTSMNTQQQAVATTTATYTVTVGDAQRSYRITHPQSHSDNVPVLVLFHGGGMNPDNTASLTGADRLAERGVFVVYPLGTDTIKLVPGQQATWNAGECCGQAQAQDVDDVAFFQAMLDDIEQRFAVTTTKVIVSGVSNGAMMAYRLACQASDRVDGLVAVAGTLAYPQCQPGQPVPVVHIHALDDQNVLFEGGCGPNCKSGYDHRSVASTIDFWKTKNGVADATPQTVLQTDTVTCEQYGSGASAVTLCTLTAGGHDWPTAQKASQFDATGFIYDTFFK